MSKNILHWHWCSGFKWWCHDIMKLRLMNKTAWTWVIGKCGVTAAKYHSLLTIQWLNKYTWVYVMNLLITTSYCLPMVGWTFERMKDNRKNLLIHLPFKLSPLQTLCGLMVIWIRGIFGLHDILDLIITIEIDIQLEYTQSRHLPHCLTHCECSWAASQDASPLGASWPI